MYKIFLYVLLLSFATAEETCTQPIGNPVLVFRKYDHNVKCTSHDAYDYYWDACETRRPTIRCEGHPTPKYPEKRLWECTFEKVNGYTVRTEVQSDYKTIHVEMIPTFNMHPFWHVVVIILVCIMVCVACCNTYHEEDNFGSGFMTGAVLSAGLWGDSHHQETCWNVS